MNNIACALTVVFGILMVVCRLLAKKTDVHEHQALLTAARELSGVFFLASLLIMVITSLPPDDMGVVSSKPENMGQGIVASVPETLPSTGMQYCLVRERHNLVGVWALATENIHMGDTVSYTEFVRPYVATNHATTHMNTQVRFLTRVVKRAADAQPKTKE